MTEQKQEEQYEEARKEIRINGQPYDEYDGIFYTEDCLKKLEALALKQGEKVGYEKGLKFTIDRIEKLDNPIVFNREKLAQWFKNKLSALNEQDKDGK